MLPTDKVDETVIDIDIDEDKTVESLNLIPENVQEKTTATTANSLPHKTDR